MSTIPDLHITKISLPKARIFKRELYYVSTVEDSSSNQLMFSSQVFRGIKKGKPLVGDFPVYTGKSTGGHAYADVVIMESDKDSLELATGLGSTLDKIGRITTLESSPVGSTAIAILSRIVELLKGNEDDELLRFNVDIRKGKGSYSYSVSYPSKGGSVSTVRKTWVGDDLPLVIRSNRIIVDMMAREEPVQAIVNETENG